MKLEIWLGNSVNFFSTGILHQDDGTSHMLQQHTSNKTTVLLFKNDKMMFSDFILTWSTNSLGIMLLDVKQGVDEIIFHNASVKDVSVEPARGTLVSSMIVHSGESKAMNWQLKYV